MNKLVPLACAALLLGAPPLHAQEEPLSKSDQRLNRKVAKELTRFLDRAAAEDEGRLQLDCDVRDVRKLRVKLGRLIRKADAEVLRGEQELELDEQAPLVLRWVVGAPGAGVGEAGRSVELKATDGPARLVIVAVAGDGGPSGAGGSAKVSGGLLNLAIGGAGGPSGPPRVEHVGNMQVVRSASGGVGGSADADAPAGGWALVVAGDGGEGRRGGGGGGAGAGTLGGEGEVLKAEGGESR